MIYDVCIQLETRRNIDNVIIEYKAETVYNIDHSELKVPENLLKKEVMSTEEEVSELHYNVHVIRTGKDIAPNLLNRHQICLVNVQKGHFEPKSTTRELYTWDKLPEDSFSVVIVDEAHHYPRRGG